VYNYRQLRPAEAGRAHHEQALARENRRQSEPLRPSAPPATPGRPAIGTRLPWWTPFLTVFVAALAARLLFLSDLRRTPYFDVLLGDAAAYDAWARQLAAGDWLGRDVFYQSPLYPYLLGVLYSTAGRDLLLVRVIQALMGATACLLVANAGARLFGRAAGVAAGLLLAFYGPALFFDATVQKSALDILLTTAVLGLAARLLPVPRHLGSALALGLALGLLSLSRENALILIPLFGAWLAVAAAERRRAVAAFAVGVLLTLGPVAARNAMVGGEWHLTTSQLGSNLYIGNNEEANGTYVPLQPGHGSAADERTDASRLAERDTGRHLRPAEVSRYWAHRAMAWATSHPMAWVELIGKKVLLAVNATEAADTEDLGTYADESWLLRLVSRVVYFGTVAPLACLGLCLTWPRRREIWILYAMGLALFAGLLVFYVFGRYRYPVVPLLVLFAGSAVARITGWWRGAPARQRAGAVAMVAAVAVVSHWPVLPVGPMQAATRYNLGYAFESTGRTADAIREYEAALELEPDTAMAHSNLSMLLLARGDRAAAEGHAREAVRLAPGMAEARNNLGTALAAAGRDGEALANFERAVSLDPARAEFQVNLGSALARAGRGAEASTHLIEAVRLDPANSGAQNNLGILLASQGDVAGALDHFAIAARLAPEDPGIAANLARARAEVARAGRARE
jgi:Flp pilus assembly protein TadD/4-amino-4-deoxy-L-arabinose transferase-like glycosyltransferase